MDPGPEYLRVLLVGDDPLARGAVRAGLAGPDEVCVVGEIDFDAALAPAILRSGAEALLWDLGSSHATPVLPVRPPLPFVVLVPNVDAARLALRGGASGVLLRDGDGDRMAGALRAALDGLLVVDDRLSAALIAPQRERVALAEPLTRREEQVLELLAEGLSNRQVGARLDISEHTAKFHVNAVMSKLGASTRTEAVVTAARAGVLSL